MYVGQRSDQAWGTGFAALASGESSAMTTAKPASRWKSMWQWRNHGPGLSVRNRIVTLSFVAGVPVETTSRQIGLW